MAVTDRSGIFAGDDPFAIARDWLAEATEAPHEVAETMLGHAVGGLVERAYRRTDFLEQRRVFLERWAAHVAGAGETS